jgi:hypothetical protein
VTNDRPPSTTEHSSEWSALAEVDALACGVKGSDAHRAGIEERKERRLTELFGLVMMLCTMLALVSALLAAHAVTEAEHGLVGFAVLGLLTAAIVHRAARAWLGEELESVGREGGLDPDEAARESRVRVERIEDRREGRV